MALWTPTQITTALWLDAADSSTLWDATSGGSLVDADGLVTRWEDKSGNARHVTQGGSANRPLRKLATQNGRDTIRFDGGGDCLFNSSATISSVSFTVLMIVKNSYRSWNGDYTRLTCFIDLQHTISNGFVIQTREDITNETVSFYTGPVSNDAQATYTPNAFMLLGAVKTQGVSNACGVNGSYSSVSNTTNWIANSWLSIGAWFTGTSHARHLDGDIAEVMIIESDSLLQRQLSEGYLAHKWGLQNNLPSDHPYRSQAPSDNSTFQMGNPI